MDHTEPHVGDRVAYIDTDDVAIGTISEVTANVPGFWDIAITWEDGLEDDDAWTWPAIDLKRVRS